MYRAGETAKFTGPMRFVALVSGGKDSVYAACQLLDEGHTLVGVIHMRTDGAYVDSYMFQTVGSEIAVLVGECLGCPQFVFETACRTVAHGLEYAPTENDEVEDLFAAVRAVAGRVPFDALCSGAILSSYQRLRVESVCARLGIASLAPLWGRDQRELLNEMIDYGIDARVVKIASPSLPKMCLGATLSGVAAHFGTLDSKYEQNWCGEGGEYETVVLDCRHFKQRIEHAGQAVHGHPEEQGKEGGVFYLELQGPRCVAK